MAEEKFLLKDHIMELDAVIRPAAVSTFLRYLNFKDSQGSFVSAKIIGPDKEEEKTNIRKCTHYDFTNIEFLIQKIKNHQLLLLQPYLTYQQQNVQHYYRLFYLLHFLERFVQLLHIILHLLRLQLWDLL